MCAMACLPADAKMALQNTMALAPNVLLAPLAPLSGRSPSPLRASMTAGVGGGEDKEAVLAEINMLKSEIAGGHTQTGTIRPSLKPLNHD